MATKHFINDPTQLVNTALAAQAQLNPALALDRESRVLYRRTENYGSSSSAKRRVRIISGGGAGHEPSFSGFVGKGLLDAGVSGTVFASPSSKQVNAGIGRLVQGLNNDDEGGVLVVVMNYTGDVLNFGMAVEKARSSTTAGMDMIVVADDVGVPRTRAGKVGRRGIAGTCLVLKIAGALAESGASLSEVAAVTRLVTDNIVSVGASLAHVHVPGRDVKEFIAEEEKLGQGVIEIGMGIHNEEGAGRDKLELPDLVKEMLRQLLNREDKERAFLEVKNDEEVVVMINNLGGISPLELSGVANEVLQQVRQQYKLKVRRVLCGTYMTSLNGQGFSVSILRLRDTRLGRGKSMLNLLDAPTEALGWSAAVPESTWEVKFEDEAKSGAAVGQDASLAQTSNLKLSYGQADKALKSGLNRLIAAEPRITAYDTTVGDGDCGIGLKRGAEAILAVLKNDKATDDACEFLLRVVNAVEDSMDGTSGALFTIYLHAVLTSLRAQAAKQSSSTQVTTGHWANALEDALTAVGKYTPARPGDRTVMDALYPFVNELSHSGGNVNKASEKAKKSADGTKGMVAKLGRSVYVGGEGFNEVPDPGAYGLAEFLLGLAEGL